MGSLKGRVTGDALKKFHIHCRMVSEPTPKADHFLLFTYLANEVKPDKSAPGIPWKLMDKGPSRTLQGVGGWR